MTSKKTLSKDDWIQAASRALTSGGHQAVKVEQIARALKVSKGSFYWHFKNADDLKQMMLKKWVEIGTKEIIRNAEKLKLSPQEKLLALGAMITTHRDEEFGSYGGVLAEAAFRDWSRFDKDVAKVSKKINKTRLNYIASLFSDLGLNKKESQLNSEIVYSALIGLEFLDQQGLAKMNTNMRALILKLCAASLIIGCGLILAQPIIFGGLAYA